MSSERKTRVEQHAYRIWEQQGQPHGRDKQHWHQAERDLADQDDANAAPGASSVEATPDAAVKAKRKASTKKDTKEVKSTGAKPAKPRKTGA